MHSDSRIAKWGHSLVVRIPLAVAKRASLSEGDPIKLAIDREGAIVLRPARLSYKLADLVSQITPKNRHRETDWGPAVGRES